MKPPPNRAGTYSNYRQPLHQLTRWTPTTSSVGTGSAPACQLRAGSAHGARGVGRDSRARCAVLPHRHKRRWRPEGGVPWSVRVGGMECEGEVPWGWVRGVGGPMGWGVCWVPWGYLELAGGVIWGQCARAVLLLRQNEPSRNCHTCTAPAPWRRRRTWHCTHSRPPARPRGATRNRPQ